MNNLFGQDLVIRGQGNRSIKRDNKTESEAITGSESSFENEPLKGLLFAERDMVVTSENKDVEREVEAERKISLHQIIMNHNKEQEQDRL